MFGLTTTEIKPTNHALQALLSWKFNTESNQFEKNSFEKTKKLRSGQSILTNLNISLGFFQTLVTVEIKRSLICKTRGCSAI